MSKVIIDTSSIINFDKLFPSLNSFRDLDGIIRKHPLNVILVDLIENIIESLLFYDEILLDEYSIRNSVGGHLAMPLDKLPYCKFIENSTYEEESVYEKILEHFGLSPSSISTIAHRIPSDWASFFDPHDNMSIKGFVGGEDAYGSFYSTQIGYFIDNVKKRMGEHCIEEVPNKILYEIVRYLYYVYLQNKEKAHLVVHPSREDIPVALGRYNHSFDWLFKSPDKRLQGRLDNRICNLTENSIPIPFIAAYVLRRSHSSEGIFDIIEDLRNSKEGRSFRKSFNRVIDLTVNYNIGELSTIKKEFEETLLNWEDNLNIVPGYWSKKITISLPFVSFDADIPYIGGNKVARNLLTFIHKTILNEDDYRKFRHMFQSIGFDRRNI